MIRQPGYLPYLGFFKKIETSDVFVFLDDVQYSIRDGDNRNKIKTSTGFKWLTIPLHKPFGKKFNEVEIANSKDWRTNHKNLICAFYQKAPFFESYWEEIESILNKKWSKLIDINSRFIEYFCKILEINTKIVFSSDLHINSTRSQRLLDISQKLNAKKYRSGSKGKNYLDEDIFLKNNIEIEYEKFTHPQYNQINGEFLENMSIIDLLFNEGENAKKILIESKNI